MFRCFSINIFSLYATSQAIFCLFAAIAYLTIPASDPLPPQSTYCPERKSAERFGLPAHFSLLSEIHEAAAAILDSRVVAVVNKYPDLVEYIHVSDQYSGPKQVRVLSYYGHKQVRLYKKC